MCFHLTLALPFSILSGLIVTVYLSSVLSVKGYSSSVVMDLIFLIQGECEEELPERVIGGARIMNPMLENCGPFESLSEQQLLERGL